MTSASSKHEAGIQSRSSGTTQRDEVVRVVGGGFRMVEHMYTHGWFMSMCGKNDYNVVK